MECRYCQASNAEDDHRCGRCGRRLRMTPVYTTSAAVPALRLEFDESEPAGRAGGVATELPPSPARRPITYQPSLFSGRELPRVVPFETIAPGVAPPFRQPSTPVRRVRNRKVIPGQQSLEFATRSLKPADGVIYCDAPVAVPAHRAMAAALDGSMILIATAIFGIIFYLAGGQVAFDAKSLPILVAVVGAFVIFYEILWCLAGGDTAGMRWARLTLVDFDGQRPQRKQRFYRLASGILSFLAAGIGLLWALVDEETLTWHDHISKTFPTPY
jgi:uncharacterized RDD family membrane protein YckC